MGHGLAVAARVDPADDPITYEERAIIDYVMGKVARLIAALANGRPASGDTWHDIAVYAKMVIRIRETGTWP